MTKPIVLSFEHADPRCRAMLLDHRTESGGNAYRALPREIIGSQVVFELKSEEAFYSFSPWRVWLSSLRLFSLLATLLPALAILFYANLSEITINWPFAFLSLLAAMGFQLSVNLLNDYEDYLKLIDLPGSRRGSGVLTNGLLRAKSVKRASWIFLILGIGFGLPVVLTYPAQLGWISILGLLGVLGYSGKPFRFKYVALGDFSLFALVGPLFALGFSLAALQLWSLQTLLLGVAFGFSATSILLASHIRDIAVDKNQKHRTLASFVGFTKARFILCTYYALSYASLLLGFFYGVMSWEVLVSIAASFVWTLKLLRRIFIASGPLSPHLESIRSLSMQAHVALGTALLLSLLMRMVMA